MSKEVLKQFTQLTLAGIVGGTIALIGSSYIQKERTPVQQSIKTIQSTAEGASYDKNQAPEFSFNGTYLIVFRDNFAIGMKAYLITEKGPFIKRELNRRHQDMSNAMFETPKNILRTDTLFSVYAVDRDGNTSAKKQLCTIEGILYEPKRIVTDSEKMQ